MKTKILIDTNIWISYLIGKTFSKLKSVIEDQNIEIIFTNTLLQELQNSFKKPRLNNYFQGEEFNVFWNYLNEITVDIEVEEIPEICRDTDDNYLLGLAHQTACEFLITGDKDLLVLEQYNNVKIVRFRDFMDS